MLHPEEEEGMIQEVLNLGADLAGDRSNGGYSKAFGGGISRDWIGILTSALELEEEGFNAETGQKIFYGGDVLDGRDWRYRWTVAVLRNLERGVAKLAIPSASTIPISTTSSALTPSSASPSNVGLQAPHSDHPLRTRQVIPGGGEEALSIEYDVIVVENEDYRVFAYGFGPEAKDHRGRRGVIVVYTGSFPSLLRR